MLALAISLVLGLYLFLPDFLFDRLAYRYIRLKKSERTTVEDILAGIFAAGIPFIAAWLLSAWSWYVGHYPAFIDQPAAEKVADYRMVISGIISEKFLESHIDAFWNALPHVLAHQFNFLICQYFFLLVEIALVVWLTEKYGDWQERRWYRATVGNTLLRRASEWWVLLTPFAFPNRQKRSVVVDAMTSDGHLYRGSVEDFFLDADGKLTGILLKDFKRFQYALLKKDREEGKDVSKTDAYWKKIDGANFFVPYEKIVTLNISYQLKTGDLSEAIRKKVQEFLREKKIKVSISGVPPQSAAPSHTAPPPHPAKPPHQPKPPHPNTAD
jgi:hypothetical protein